MSTEIVKSGTYGMMTFDEMERASKAIANSGLFGLTKPEQVMALGLLAQAEGRPFAIVARDYHIIQGRPTLKADAMLSRFQESGGKVKWLKFDDQACEAEFSHPLGGVLVVGWDMARAKQAQLTTAMWSKYPRQMLKARVISDGVRATYPAALSGCYTPEEVADFDKGDTTQDVQTLVASSAPVQVVEGVQTPEVLPKQEAPTPTEPKKAAGKLKAATKPVQQVPKPTEADLAAKAKVVEVLGAVDVTPRKEATLADPIPTAPVAPVVTAPAPEVIPEEVVDNTPLLEDDKKPAILMTFARFKLVQADLEYYLAKTMDKWTMQDRKTLLERFAILQKKPDAALNMKVPT